MTFLLALAILSIVGSEQSSVLLLVRLLGGG